MTSLAQTIRQSCHQAMQHRTESKVKKTRVVPARIRMLGIAFNLAARFNLEWTAGLLSEFWVRVFKPKPRHWVHGFWNSADKSVELHLHDKTIPLYLWGKGPLVVCIHGWGGSGTQFRQLIPALVESGYQVASFDAPAHGMNPGSKTHVLEFAQCLLEIRQQVAPIHTVVAHSFGAMATLMARYHGLPVERMVLLAPGLDVQEIFHNYSNSLGLNKKLVERFRVRVGEKMSAISLIDDPWNFFTPRQLTRYVADRGLMVYDLDDEEVSPQLFHSVARDWEQVETIETRGLGHYRILKDTAVIASIAEWMKQD